MYEVRQIIDNPEALDGPLIIRTEDLDEAELAIEVARKLFRKQLLDNAEGATDAVFVTVLIDWSSYKPFPPGFKAGAHRDAWLTRWWDVTTIDLGPTEGAA